ncbi:MAG: O-linked GlcNAc transferase, partial [Symploca sp. SIO2B6]|nr:O-linked GlcNAc transferase [Symploca sp. SIO2B6]
MTLRILEQCMLDAERAFEEQLYLEGKGYLEEALAEEPTYGKAHNHLGWLYLYHLNDLDKAERHLKLALKYTNSYKAPYIHMSTLLFDQGRFDECELILAQAEQVPGVEKSFIFNEYGRLNEVKGQYRSAIKSYKDAIKWSLNDHE